MKRVFISQPMNGKSDVEILNARAAAAQAAQDHLGEEVEILNTFWNNTGARALQLLGQSISVLAQADLAYFCKGWEEARGCKIEHECAVEYGINVLEA
ncbi:MAG: DUF4406 domain-containing protein [Lachnospiraceae bacterium]|nr:DUF4406 domain-containing protein [Lachnospiraceae bacterium]MCM1233014.1 DUF4406 domain-containing protein [Ruminococcus flavefaciens]